MSVGTTSGVRSITTMVKPQTDPNQFSFTIITGANYNQVYTSNTITLTGMGAGLTNTVILSGRGALYKNGTNI